MSNVKTRFAPSPTGRMHVGNLRTALYAYLIAKHDDVRFAGCQIGLYFLFGKTKAVFVVDRDFFSAYVTLALAQALCVTEAVISVTLLYQLFCVFQVQTCCITLALYVRAAAAVFVRSLVVYQAGLF